MTGYDGIVACLQQAMADSQVRGVLLDIDSPGGQAAGAFDCADMIYRLRQQKPVWALCNDTACSAAMLLASACSRRLVTQTSRIGSIGVMMSHVSYAGHLAQAGVDITLIYSGAHKVDGNQFEALPAEVRQDMQQRIDAARRMFAEKVAMFTGLSVDAVTGTEAAVFEGQAAMPEMTVEKARPILAASPQADAGPSLRDQIMALDEAKGAEAQAEQLAACPGMTVESARAVLAAGSGKAEPVSASTTALFERIMANHSPAAVQGGVPQTSADGDADVKMLMAMP